MPPDAPQRTCKSNWGVLLHALRRQVPARLHISAGTRQAMPGTAQQLVQQPRYPHRLALLPRLELLGKVPLFITVGEAQVGKNVAEHRQAQLQRLLRFKTCCTIEKVRRCGRPEKSRIARHACIFSHPIHPTQHSDRPGVAPGGWSRVGCTRFSQPGEARWHMVPQALLETSKIMWEALWDDSQGEGAPRTNPATMPNSQCSADICCLRAQSVEHAWQLARGLALSRCTSVSRGDLKSQALRVDKMRGN